MLTEAVDDNLMFNTLCMENSKFRFLDNARLSPCFCDSCDSSFPIKCGLEIIQVGTCSLLFSVKDTGKKHQDTCLQHPMFKASSYIFKHLQRIEILWVNEQFRASFTALPDQIAADSQVISVASPEAQGFLELSGILDFVCFLRVEAIPSRLEAIALRLEAIAFRLEAIALRLEAIALRVEAIALSAV